MKFLKRCVALIFALMLTVMFTACEDGDSYTFAPVDDEALAGANALTTREATGTYGVVTSANAYASQAGIEVLEQGGNAFDAAVAVSFALGVVEPYASGIGGGGVMTAYNAKTGEYVFYNFREFAPAAGTAEKYRELGADANIREKIDKIEEGATALEQGVTSIGVPTQVAGLCSIYEDLGSGNVTLKDILTPAIGYAENGFILQSTLVGQMIDGYSKFTVYDATKKKDRYIVTQFMNGLDFYNVGDRFYQKDYAKVLKEIAKNGAKGFYEGWVADAIIEAMNEYGGIITQDDLTYAMNNYPKKGSPLYGEYTNQNGTFDIYTANLPSSGGIILLEALNMFEHYCDKYQTTLTEVANDTTEYAHLLSQVMNMCYSDKRHYMADNSINPATGQPFVNVPITGLLSKQYAAQRFDAIYDANRASVLSSTYDWGGATLTEEQKNAGYKESNSPWDYNGGSVTINTTDDQEELEHYSTTSFSVADKDGNIVSFTQTINHFWGSFVMPKGCGFFLNNQLSSFYCEEEKKLVYDDDGSVLSGSVHYVEPYKQPVSHIMPTIVMKDGLPYATFGSPGSTRIPSAVIQVALNLMDFNLDIQSAIAKARIYCYGMSKDDAGYNKDVTQCKKLVELELDGTLFDQTVVTNLESKNYVVNPTTAYNNIDLYFGGVQGIKFNYDTTGKLVSMTGGADPRRDGKALAYSK